MALTDEQKLFAEWLITPPELRDPGTQRELAVMLNVSEMTLSRWKKQKGFQEYTDNTLVVKMRDRLGEIHEALFNHAINGKHPKYMEMALQIAANQGIGKKEIDLRITAEDTRTMTTEEAATRLHDLLSQTGALNVAKADFVQALNTAPMSLN